MNFATFFKTGWEHIVDINAYDHLLFVMTLCAAFKLTQWKQILVIITAFTIGHCGTLILSALSIIPSNDKVINTLIPLTIMITAISNILFYDKQPEGKRKINYKYIIALVFGLIHGLAFASNFKFMTIGGGNILLPLFAFNIGIEVGQIFIVILFMLLLFIYQKYIKGSHLTWNTFVSGAGFGIATTILINTINGGN